jgi:hypothetical protein
MRFAPVLFLAWSLSALAEPQAVGFRGWDELLPRQRLLLSTLPGVPLEDDGSWQEWARAHDGQAAAFLAITQALARIRLEVARDQWRSALELIDSLAETRGDRIHVQRDVATFDRWRERGGRFEIDRADGVPERGAIRFNKGVLFGGSVHEGFDLQGYTSARDVPRMQWNIRLADALTDIDLDGYAPIQGGLPNPGHLTWENSDVRYWPESYARKFADPGFEVVDAGRDLNFVSLKIPFSPFSR